MRASFDVHPRAVASGLASFVPGLHRFTNRGSGGTMSARYCYSVWLRHLVRAQQSGLPTDPACVAELGPGDSLGIGLAAVLSGADRYVALDVKVHANVQRNLQVFEELVQLFRDRASIPDDSEWPLTQPKLARYAFPDQILPAARMQASLAESRLREIRRAIAGEPAGIQVDYRAPWNDPATIEAASVDYLFSQAVLEHVEDLEVTYAAMRTWMKPAAPMSHSIDFSSHDLTRAWNGHWALGDGLWRIVRGTRRYLINREPWSTHLALLKKNGFAPVLIEPRGGEVAPGFRPAGRFRHLSAEDLSTRGVFVQARASSRSYPSVRSASTG